MSALTGTKFLSYSNSTVGPGRVRYYLTYDPAGANKLVSRPLDTGDTSHQQWQIEGGPGEDDGWTMKCAACSNALSTSDFTLTWTATASSSAEPALWYFDKRPTGDYILSHQSDKSPPWWAVLPFSPSPILLLHDGRYDAFEIEDVTPSRTGTTTTNPATTGTSSGRVNPTATSAAPTSSSTTPIVVPTSSSSGGLSTGAKVAIGISIPVGIVALVLLFLVFRRRRGTSAHSKPVDSEKAKDVDDITSVGSDISEGQGRVLAANDATEVGPAPGDDLPEQAGPRNGANGG